MKLILLSAFIIVFASCKKERPDQIDLDANNEFKAIVAYPNFDTIRVNATGKNADIGCSYGHGVVEGAGVTTALVSISLDSCTSGTGTFPIQCTFSPSPTSYEAYSNSSSNPGSITYTIVTNSYMEGYFDALCMYNGRTVKVTGTFKGHREVYL